MIPSSLKKIHSLTSEKMVKKNVLQLRITQELFFRSSKKLYVHNFTYNATTIPSFMEILSIVLEDFCAQIFVRVRKPEIFKITLQWSISSKMSKKFAPTEYSTYSLFLWQCPWNITLPSTNAAPSKMKLGYHQHILMIHVCKFVCIRVFLPKESIYRGTIENET